MMNFWIPRMAILLLGAGVYGIGRFLQGREKSKRLERITKSSAWGIGFHSSAARTMHPGTQTGQTPSSIPSNPSGEVEAIGPRGGMGLHD